MEVITVPFFKDNYSYALDYGKDVVVVDPGSATVIARLLTKLDARLHCILITHHHNDHCDGVRDLLDAFPGTPVVASARDHGKVRHQSVLASEGDKIPLPSGHAIVIEVPGHTLGHLAYLIETEDGLDLFVGDTLFGLTIGNLFDGTPAMMLDSLKKIRALPPHTRIWCGHEYTREYAEDALQLDPDNERLKERISMLKRSTGPTVPLELSEEIATNPYLRWDDPQVQRHLCTHTDEATFERMCAIG